MKLITAFFLLLCSQSIIAGNSIKGLYYQPEVGQFFGATSYTIKTYEYDYLNNSSSIDYKSESQKIRQSIYYSYSDKIRFRALFSYTPEKTNSTSSKEYKTTGFGNPILGLNYFLNNELIISGSLSPALIDTKHASSTKTGTVASPHTWLYTSIAKHQTWGNKEQSYYLGITAFSEGEKESSSNSTKNTVNSTPEISLGYNFVYHYNNISSFILSYDLILLGEYTVDYASGSKDESESYYTNTFEINYRYSINNSLLVSSGISTKLPYEVNREYNSDDYSMSYKNRYSIRVGLTYDF